MEVVTIAIVVVCGRNYVQRNYADLKALNPSLPILIRECSGVRPRIWARYGENNANPVFSIWCKLSLFHIWDSRLGFLFGVRVSNM